MLELQLVQDENPIYDQRSQVNPDISVSRRGHELRRKVCLHQESNLVGSRTLAREQACTPQRLTSQLNLPEQNRGQPQRL